MRTALAALAAASVLAGSAVAHGAVAKGTYTGKTSDGGRVSLVVDKKQRLVKITRKAMRFKCSDGDKFTSLKHTATGVIDVADGRFDIADTTPDDGVEWEMTGVYSEKKKVWKGELQETRRFNSKNRLDPKGSVVCSTAELTYRAART
jgi:hypothetical protein